MLTLLPYSSFVQSLMALDKRDLKWQFAQVRAIMASRNHSHPSVLMWKGHENALAEYHNLCRVIALRRGIAIITEPLPVTIPVEMPRWLGDERLHASHRYFLQLRGYDFKEDPQPLFWPVKEDFNNSELL